MVDLHMIVSAVAAVFTVIAIGLVARKLNWLTQEADTSLLKMIIRVLLPCLIFDYIVGNDQLRQAKYVLLPPLVGFATLTIGLLVALAFSRLPARFTGLTDAKMRRTFAFCVGIFNYGYIPIPLAAALFGKNTVGVLLVHNLGVEVAFWSVGMVVLTGGLGKGWWKHVINPPLFAIVIALGVNFWSLDGYVPDFATGAIKMVGQTSIPMGLLLIGATMADHLVLRGRGIGFRIMTGANLLRMAAIPFLFLLVAKYLPCPDDLKRVIIIEAAMPAAVFPIIMAKHYDGDPPTAMRVILSTSVVSLVTISFWVEFGLRFVGLP